MAEDIPFLMSVGMTRGFGRLANWSELLGKEHLFGIMQISFSLITSYQSPSTFQCKNEPHKDGGIVVMRIVTQN